MFSKLMRRWKNFRTEAAFRSIAKDTANQRWPAARAKLLTLLERAKSNRNADQGIRTLHGLMLVYAGWGIAESALEAAQGALTIAESAGHSVNSDAREEELLACCATVETLTAQAVARKLRILRFARAIVGEQQDYVEDEVGADEHLDGCWSFVSSQLGFPHWLHSVVLCEMAEERAQKGQREEYVRMMERAEQIASEFDDNGPAAQAIRSTRNRFDSNW